jgi:hypothetical protein
MKIMKKPIIKSCKASVELIPEYHPIIKINGIKICIGTLDETEEFFSNLYSNTFFMAGTNIKEDLAKILIKAKMIESYCDQANRYKITKAFLHSKDAIEDAFKKSCHDAGW